MILGHGEKVWQEFYCRHCPADDPTSKDPEKTKTGGHFRVKFSLGYDAGIKIHCPKCAHVHERHVKNGVLYDGGGTSGYTDEVRVPKSAWSRDPFTKKAEAAKKSNPRDAFQSALRGNNVIASPDDLSKAAAAAVKGKGAAGRGGTFLQLHEPDKENGNENENAADETEKPSGG